MLSTRNIIGIDIGSFYTKVVAIELGPKPTLLDAFYFSTPLTDSTVGKKIDHSKLSKDIFEKIAPHRFRDSRIATNIYLSSPVVMTVTLPKMRRKELAVASLTEARRKMIPTPGPHSVFETLFVGEVVEANIPRHEVLIVREEQDVINNTLRLFQSIDATPILVTPLCSIYGRLLARSVKLKNKEVAFIDIGYSSMNISVFRGSSVIFNRTISFGCRDIITGFSASLDISAQKAEDILIDKGIPDVEFDPKNRVAIAEEVMRQKYETSQKGVEPEEVCLLELRMFLEPFIERVVQEIRRTFIYFKERYETRQIEEIFFLGGGSLIGNLVPLVGKRISPFPSVIDPVAFGGLTLKDPERDIAKSLFTGAIGLALSTTQKADTLINFVPIELRKKEEIAIKRSLFVGISILMICGLLLLWLNFFILTLGAKSSLSRINFELDRLRDVSEKEEGLKAEIAAIDKRRSGVDELAIQKADTVSILKDLVEVKGSSKKMFFTDLLIHVPDATIAKEVSKEETASFFQKLFSKRTSTERAQAALKLLEGEPLFEMQLKMKVFSDFEGTYRLIEEFNRKLYKKGRFTSIKTEPPEDELEVIVPEVTGMKVELTGQRWREFTVTADLDIEKQ